MKLFLDVITGYEVASDSSKFTIEDDIFYKFEMKFVDDDEDNQEYNTGANASADDAPEQQLAAQKKPQVLNLVKYHRLIESPFGTVKSYKLFLKDYLGQLKEHVEPERYEKIKKPLGAAVQKHIADDFKECQFFVGGEGDGGVHIVKYKDNIPYLYVLKDGVREEKV